MRSTTRMILMAWAASALLLGLVSPDARAAFEVSGGFSFNRSNYSSSSYSWTRRWGLNFGYHLYDNSVIEVGLQDITDRTSIANYEDTTFHDQIYSINWVQSFFGKNSPFQPYVKAGIGQLNRVASGTYALGGISPPSELDQVTGIVGAGLKMYLTRTFGIRGEVTSYLTEGKISTWQDNFGVTFGVSLYF